MERSELHKADATEKLVEVQNELHCSICQDFFDQASTLSCSHSFCFSCIDVWRQTHSDCPVCRREILGMAPSRALDNMVAAFVDRTHSVVQASLQQFGTWRNPTPTQQTNSVQTNNWDDSDFEEYILVAEDLEPDVDSYSDGSYDAEEEEEESYGEEEEDQDDGVEEEEEEDGSVYSNSEDDDEEEEEDDESSDDDVYNDHVTRSNQNNPNNDEYWILRGRSCRPDNWRELLQRELK